MEMALQILKYFYNTNAKQMYQIFITSLVADAQKS